MTTGSKRPRAGKRIDWLAACGTWTGILSIGLVLFLVASIPYAGLSQELSRALDRSVVLPQLQIPGDAAASSELLDELAARAAGELPRYRLATGLWGPLHTLALFGLLAAMAVRFRRGEQTSRVVLVPAGLGVLAGLLETVVLATTSSGSLLGLATLLTTLKWALAGVALVVALWPARRRFGRILAQFYYARVPVLVLLILLALAVLGGSNLLTVANMMLIDSWLGMAVATFAALVAAAAAGFFTLLIWSQAHYRFGLEEKVLLPRILDGETVLRTVPFLFFAVPLVARMLLSSTTRPNGTLSWPAASLGATLGAVAAVLALLFVEWIRNRSRRALGPTAIGDAIDWVWRKLGPGYWLEGSPTTPPRVAPGHNLALVGFIVFAVLYFVAYRGLEPTVDRPVPTIAYILFLLIVVPSFLSGMAFFLDRFRVPLLLGIAVWVAVVHSARPLDHYFEVSSARDAEKVDPFGYAQVRLERQKEHFDASAAPERKPVLTVVGASGGGIQAAAWTTQVLTGLQTWLGEDFARSIYLISATSGGSVGTYFYLEGVDAGLAAPRPDALGPIREASMASSLEATAWGLTFPDLTRLILPVVDPLRDRAWATEQAWLRATQTLRQSLGDDSTRVTRMSDWMAAATRGDVPAVVLNATIVEDGGHFSNSNLDLSSVPVRNASIADPALVRHYPGVAPLDMQAVTAARLSATFPYVTPNARALAVSDDPQLEGAELPAWHFADGGLFDNFGVVASVDFLRLLSSEESPVRLEDYSQVLFVLINAFPRSRTDVPDAESSRGIALSGPFTAILNVLNSTQRLRSDLEIGLVEDLVDGRLHVVEFRPPVRPRTAPDPPLSWDLSTTDKQEIELGWRACSNARQVQALEGCFPGAAQRRPEWTCIEDDVGLAPAPAPGAPCPEAITTTSGASLDATTSQPTEPLP